MRLINSLLSYSGNRIVNSSQLLNFFSNFNSSSLRIVYYHAVTDSELSFYFDGKAISPKEFEEQLIFLKNHYQIISLSEAIDLAHHNKSLKKKLVITFDDGFKLNYSTIAPILTKHKVTATFFLIGNCIDNQDLMWRNKIQVLQNYDKKRFGKTLSQRMGVSEKKLNETSNLMEWTFYRLPMNEKEEVLNYCWKEIMEFSLEEYLSAEKPYLTSTEIIELQDLGFEFGSHSNSHPVFTNLSYDEFKKEIEDSVIKIERITGNKVNSFSYPFGRRSPYKYELKFQSESDFSIKTFLGTRNNLRNHGDSIIWERDNVEHDFSVAMSRFFLLSVLRNKIKYLS